MEAALDEENRSLYVGNLEPSCTEELIYTIFSRISPVLRCKMIYSTGKDPFCFVEFHSRAGAQLAKYQMDRREIMGKSIKVNWATNSQGMKRGDTNNHHHIFVGDLAEDIDDNTLRKTFEPFGDISEARVVKEANKNKSKGFGFVAFVKKEDATRAISEMNGADLMGKPIRTNWASRKNNPVQSKPLNWDEVFHKSSQLNTTIYVGNLPPDIKDYDLQNLFSQYGQILEIKLFAEKGYAFVKFSNHNEATSGIVGTHNQTTLGDPNNPYLLRCSWGKETPEMMNFQQAGAWQQQYYAPFYYQQSQSQPQQQMQHSHQQQPQQQYIQYPGYAMYFQQGSPYAAGQGMAMYPVQNYSGVQMSSTSTSGIQTPTQSPQVMGMQATGLVAPQGAPQASYAMQPAAGYHAQ
ncbi:nucleolysin TIAR isoform X2 [Exaiptasia diaphana]|uniref:RRM domain-containing protein n=1 Tax=Exaiptasia diaphana TaxID=2652724 RepID=A0A913XQA5_EXADI|nr:nucleolysin TIAR isoform X2 [Exaiptasia diaphana]